MSINYSGYAFSDPVPLSDWSPPYRAGLYAILVYDSTLKPKPYRVLYFGESGNMSERGFGSHHAYPCWIRGAKGSALYISVWLMPDSTSEDRRAVEEKLIGDYAPPCNR